MPKRPIAINSIVRPPSAFGGSFRLRFVDDTGRNLLQRAAY